VNAALITAFVTHFVPSSRSQLGTHANRIFKVTYSKICLKENFYRPESVESGTARKEEHESSKNMIRGCIKKFPDWPPGARTANGTALCHYV
jgi:hypothetical protein